MAGELWIWARSLAASACSSRNTPAVAARSSGVSASAIFRPTVASFRSRAASFERSASARWRAAPSPDSAAAISRSRASSFAIAVGASTRWRRQARMNPVATSPPTTLCEQHFACEFWYRPHW